MNKITLITGLVGAVGYVVALYEATYTQFPEEYRPHISRMLFGITIFAICSVSILCVRVMCRKEKQEFNPEA